MDLLNIQPNWVLEKIEFAVLKGQRPRVAGSNGRIGVHGKASHVAIARITIDGETAYGASFIKPEQAAELIGKRVIDLFDAAGKVLEEYRLLLEFPLLDWLGRRQHEPVYALLTGQSHTATAPLAVPCYDTSLYFDDLHLADDAEAVALLRDEASQGYASGHRHFKIKVGRGGRHMPVIAGTNRDIAIVQGISELAGPSGKIMIDANNAYNLNLTKDVLSELSNVNLYWLEEAFHEDDALYEDLKSWLHKRNQHVLIADGEGLASPLLIDWAIKGFVDVLQYDIVHPGITRWLELGAQFDAHGLRSAPHCYGNAYGIYASGHLANVIKGFEFVEYDAILIEGMDASAYRVVEGELHIPNAAGFGLAFDDELFTKTVAQEGWFRA